LTNHYKEAHDPSSLSPIHHQQGEIAGSLREIIQSTVHESICKSPQKSYSYKVDKIV